MEHTRSFNRLALAQGVVWAASGLTAVGRRVRPSHLLAALPLVGAFLWRRRAARKARLAGGTDRLGITGVGQWDIAPGETLEPDGHRDLVTEASMESFPGSDPPAIGQAR